MFSILGELFLTSSNNFFPLSIKEAILLQEAFNKSLISSSINNSFTFINSLNSNPNEKQIELSNSSAISIGTDVLSPIV